ncbi:hypothetical protein [Mucilaginibacter paludis]|uniref:Uncharacterized protein n=1 Tax=Mucilaginibacter paludis DSM 18603 TaxID=714943 RepID=H1Y430_9SPHI|nr:hypothetical protein [Mucilaginibacter paludis]EHQ24766.1 hypothetical protein Mucpa_0574 [Mucilaginibacter paludis DSM 18603]
MLSSISWQHYLAAVIILTVAYYGYVILRYYQQEISGLFNRKQKTGVFAAAQSVPAEVMGAAKLENGVSVSNSEELYCAELSPDESEQIALTEETPDSGFELVLSPAEELEAEAGNLIAAFREIDNKPEFINLLRILIDSYQRFKEDIDLQSVLIRIVKISNEKLMFPLSLADLQGTWA